MKTDSIHCKVEPELKTTVDNILSELGLNTSQAITLFYKQIALKHGLPFEVESLPNKTTLKTMQKTDEGQELTICKDANDMFDKLGI
jgi:DNA-damage-inducible protein J